MLYSLYSASFIDGDNGELHMTQLLAQDVANGARVEEYVVPGTLDRAVNLLMGAEPKIALRSHDGLFFLQNVNLLTGFRCDEGATFRWQKRAQNLDTDGAGTLGAFMAETEHALTTSTGGFLCPTSIDVAQGQLATFNYDYWPLWTGDRSVLPLVTAFSQDLEQTPSFNSAYTLGPIKLTSGSPSLLPGLTGWSFQTGLRIVPRIEEGQTFPSTVTLEQRTPRIVMQFDTPERITQIGNMFHAAIANTITLYLRRKSGTTGHGNVADGTGSHAYIDAQTATWSPEQFSAQDHASARLSVPLLPIGTVRKSYTATIPTS